MLLMDSPATVAVTAIEGNSTSSSSNFVAIDDLLDKNATADLSAMVSVNAMQVLENHFLELSEPNSNQVNDVVEVNLSFNATNSATVT